MNRLPLKLLEASSTRNRWRILMSNLQIQHELKDEVAFQSSSDKLNKIFELDPTNAWWRYSFYQLQIKHSISTKWYLGAYFYLDKVDSLARVIQDEGNVMVNYFYRFQVDSAPGHYQLTLAHLLEYWRRQDSLYTIQNEARLDELQIEYDTEKKEIRIHALTKENDCQDLGLRESNLIRHYQDQVYFTFVH